MENSWSISIKNYAIKIQTKNGKTSIKSFHSFVEHIFLLQQVIQYPGMRIKGTLFDSFIKIYCMKMSKSEMSLADQQSKLPWEIEWI